MWRPTLPSAAPFSAPWLGFVKPLLLRSGAQFDPGPPPSLTSRRYAKDFNEVKDYGSTSPTTKRTAEMTATGLFYAGNPIVQLTRALRDQAAKRHLDIVDSARMFAAVHMSLADASIAIWWTKYHYGSVASDHRDPAGRHRRQPPHRDGRLLGALRQHDGRDTARDTAVPGLRQRLQRRHGCLQPGAGGRTRHPAPGPEADQHGRPQARGPTTPATRFARTSSTRGSGSASTSGSLTPRPPRWASRSPTTRSTTTSSRSTTTERKGYGEGRGSRPRRTLVPTQTGTSSTAPTA